MKDSFSNRLNQALKFRNMKAVDLVETTGLSKGRISQYINGLYTPKADALFAIAKALDVNEEWLIGNDDEIVPMEKITIKEKNKFTNEWETKYNPNDKLSDEVRMIEKIQSQFGNKSVKMLDLFNQLNDLGQTKAIETVSDLTEIPKYTKETPKYIYRVARSTNNADAEILERDEKTIEKLKSAKKITSDEDI